MTRKSIGQFYAIKKLEEGKAQCNKDENNDQKVDVAENPVDTEPKNPEEERALEEIRRMLGHDQENNDANNEGDVMNLDDAEAILNKSVLEQSQNKGEEEKEEVEEIPENNANRSGESEEALDEEDIVALEMNVEDNKIEIVDHKTLESNQDDIFA